VTILQSIILGIVQGLTEFLPISSSGHLVLAQNLFGFSKAGLSFDVALHLGTFLALILFFWREWIRIIKDFGRS
jgi:undecaprenyl-diphosphatase